MRSRPRAIFVYNILSMRTYQFDNPLAERRGSTQLIADALREAIIQGQLTAGEPLRQEQLASHFSVSRIPLREALRCLESEGWIEFLPNRGARVSRLSASEALEGYEIRASLERTALELAFPLHNEQTWRDVEAALQAALKEKQRPHYVHRNREFHLALYRPAERPYLLGLIDSLHKRGERYLRLKLEMPFHKHKSDDEHERIYAACRRGDLDTAIRILTAHLLETGSLLADYLRRGPQAAAAR
jgi:DNA-binding GntR family transcriptional regulator